MVLMTGMGLETGKVLSFGPLTIQSVMRAPEVIRIWAPFVWNIAGLFREVWPSSLRVPLKIWQRSETLSFAQACCPVGHGQLSFQRVFYLDIRVFCRKCLGLRIGLSNTWFWRQWKWTILSRNLTLIVYGFLWVTCSRFELETAGLLGVSRPSDKHTI